MKILVADDDPISNKVLTETLTRWGHDVVSAPDGQLAWEALQAAEAPRLAILDWMMPGLSGLELCQKIRAQLPQPYTYVIFLTGKTEKSDVVIGLQAGADDYLTKPYDPQELEVRIGVGQRILRLESELLDTLEQLKRSEKNRGEFISALTHDLRTPLAAERNALEIILHSESRISDTTQQLLKGLHSNNENLLKLVNQLLENFQASEVDIHLNPEDTRLHELVERCVLSLQALANEKNIRLLNGVSQTLPAVRLDAYQIQRVLTNLISNAIANIPSACEVTISAEERDNQIEIRVADNGPGISAELLPHLFERYYSGAGLNRKLGSGLGLSICKKLVGLHQGEIGVQSVLGEGATFYFTLPLNADQLVWQS